MNGLKIPGWAQAVAASLIAALITISTGLVTYLFLELKSEVRANSEITGQLRQDFAVIQARLDTQYRFCQFPKKGE